jgi:DNA replication protein DnaC
MNVKEEIADCCKRLRLSRALAEGIESINETEPKQFLLKVLKNEIEHREETRKARCLKTAGFYTLKTFQDYVFDNITLPSSITVDKLKALTFLDKKQNLILYGNVGTGKTHLATALGVSACQKGKRVRFFRTSALVNELLDAKKGGRLNRLLKSITKLDLLICDEWGYVPLDRDGSRLLFNVISDCYEQRSVIITTNLEFSRWVTVLYDEQMTAAMIDRLVHHSHLLIFDGESWRMRNSLIRS